MKLLEFLLPVLYLAVGGKVFNPNSDGLNLSSVMHLCFSRVLGKSLITGLQKANVTMEDKKKPDNYHSGRKKKRGDSANDKSRSRTRPLKAT